MPPPPHAFIVRPPPYSRRRCLHFPLSIVSRPRWRRAIVLGPSIASSCLQAINLLGNDRSRHHSQLIFIQRPPFNRQGIGLVRVPRRRSVAEEQHGAVPCDDHICPRRAPANPAQRRHVCTSTSRHRNVWPAGGANGTLCEPQGIDHRFPRCDLVPPCPHPITDCTDHNDLSWVARLNQQPRRERPTSHGPKGHGDTGSKSRQHPIRDARRTRPVRHGGNLRTNSHHRRRSPTCPRRPGPPLWQLPQPLLLDLPPHLATS